jgi:hypothetical protein
VNGVPGAVRDRDLVGDKLDGEQDERDAPDDRVGEDLKRGGRWTTPKRSSRPAAATVA